MGTSCGCRQPGCEECEAAAALAALIAEDFALLTRDAKPPTPEIVWWRAQMRAREEANRTAARPILFTQALAAAALTGLLLSVAGRITLPLLSWSFLTLPNAVPVLPIAIVAAAAAVITPVVLYLAD